MAKTKMKLKPTKQRHKRTKARNLAAKHENSKKTESLSDTGDFNLGERLRYLRDLRKLTQKGLAAAAGVSQGTIAHIEGGTKDPSVGTLKKIAAALDTHPAIFFTTNDIFVFDLPRLRRRYSSADQLPPYLYMAMGRLVQYARDIEFLR